MQSEMYLLSPIRLSEVWDDVQQTITDSLVCK